MLSLNASSSTNNFLHCKPPQTPKTKLRVQAFKSCARKNALLKIPRYQVNRTLNQITAAIKLISFQGMTIFLLERVLTSNSSDKKQEKYRSRERTEKIITSSVGVNSIYALTQVWFGYQPTTFSSNDLKVAIIITRYLWTELAEIFLSKNIGKNKWLLITGHSNNDTFFVVAWFFLFQVCQMLSFILAKLPWINKLDSS